MESARWYRIKLSEVSSLLSGEGYKTLSRERYANKGDRIAKDNEYSREWEAHTTVVLTLRYVFVKGFSSVFLFLLFCVCRLQHLERRLGWNLDNSTPATSNKSQQLINSWPENGTWSRRCRGTNLCARRYSEKFERRFCPLRLGNIVPILVWPSSDLCRSGSPASARQFLRGRKHTREAFSSAPRKSRGALSDFSFFFCGGGGVKSILQRCCNSDPLMHLVWGSYYA